MAEASRGRGRLFGLASLGEAVLALARPLKLRVAPLTAFSDGLCNLFGLGRLSRELNIGAGSSRDSAGNAGLVVVFGFSFLETKCLFVALGF